LAGKPFDVGLVVEVGAFHVANGPELEDDLPSPPPKMSWKSIGAAENDEGLVAADIMTKAVRSAGKRVPDMPARRVLGPPRR
jgi:hypothetical protein